MDTHSIDVEQVEHCCVVGACLRLHCDHYQCGSGARELDLQIPGMRYRAAPRPRVTIDGGPGRRSGDTFCACVVMGWRHLSEASHALHHPRFDMSMLPLLRKDPLTAGGHNTRQLDRPTRSPNLVVRRMARSYWSHKTTAVRCARNRSLLQDCTRILENYQVYGCMACVV